MDKDNNLTILFEDNHILVCVKPPGILSQSDGHRRLDMATIIKEYLKEKYHKPGNVFVGLVHRLDLNVGGVMVYAKTSKAASRLSESIRNQDVQKHYFAILNAKLNLDYSDTFIDWMSKDEHEIKAIPATESNGKEARLSFRVVKTMRYNNKPLTLVDILLETGRFHQIRYQFASRNMSLYGDEKYGAPRIRNKNVIGLFAYQLSFPHPVTKENMVFKVTPTEGIFKSFFK